MMSCADWSVHAGIVVTVLNFVNIGYTVSDQYIGRCEKPNMGLIIWYAVMPHALMIQRMLRAAFLKMIRIAYGLHAYAERRQIRHMVSHSIRKSWRHINNIMERPIPTSDDDLLGLELDSVLEEHEHTSADGNYRIHSLPRSIERRLSYPTEDQ
jgi:hypothetical protein